MTPARRTAFTLLEIIVVIGIVILLLLLIVPGTLKVMETGKSVACVANLKQLGLALNQYLADHDLTMPTMESGRSSLAENKAVLDTTLNTYAKDKRLFVCPADKRIAAKTGTSYYWNSALNGQKVGSMDFLKLTEERSKIPVITDKEGFHPYLENKVNVLYADGHATKELKFVTDDSASAKAEK